MYCKKEKKGGKKMKWRKRNNVIEEKKLYWGLRKGKRILKKKKTIMMYHTFSQLSYVANYGWLSILIIVLCDKLWLAVCYYHINYHFFLYYSKSITYETFDKMCEKCVVLVSSRNIYIYILELQMGKHSCERRICL